ncbi:MAG: hypothetical protein OEZ01_01730, partial [Candidatus Heimdallarchaeota archaeon]|nr:hypothetical protein [Candidatus Heimdallarchaeota archaeon]
WPIFLFVWGILGYNNTESINAFIIGLIVSGLLGIIFLQINDPKDIYDQSIGKIAIVDIPINPGKKGQIILETDNGREYFVAEGIDNEINTIPKWTKVVISHFNGVYAQVYEFNSNFKINKPSEKKSYSKIIKFIRKKSKDKFCMICFADIGILENSSSCPQCNYNAHIEHLKAWLEIRNVCPNCKAILQFDANNIVNIS